jgi:predicted DNA-binding transcriptional regulator AlpA
MDSFMIDQRTAAQLCGMSKSHFRKLEIRGDIGPVPVRAGRKLLYNKEELARWCAAGMVPRAKWQPLNR